MPARWTPLPEPVQLSEDSGTYYRDRNAAGYPKYPLEPAVRSILALEADNTDTTPRGRIDLFACGATLGNLLRFVRGTASSFRMLVEMVGSTVHLVRRERSPFETIPNVRGYGHSFPSAYTTWDPDVRGSSSHQRIISYRLGALGLLCSFEGDGFLAPDPHSNPTTARDGQTEEASTASGGADDVHFSGLAVSPRTPVPGNSDFLGADEPELKVSAAGELLSQDSIFELKTRSIKRQGEQDAFIELQLHRLWLRQVPNLVLGYHKCGLFTDIRVIDVRSQLREFEQREAPTLNKFVALLRKIVDAARDGLGNGSRIEITYTEGSKDLCIREQEPGLPKLLSQPTLERWEAWLGERVASGSTGEDSCSDLYGVSDDDSDGSYVELDDYRACDDDCGYCGLCR
ncbi:hypothetical protein E4U43_003516 [Claviceps pusilla]|uniref:Uncharacterized protein n=1 Tax=Claviceps pusilla TaxID=123648 RepID=A0A9P7N6Q7_9HYPO|nr:hypothetical protein E4U43_003516 [Claviceps pusilla]